MSSPFRYFKTSPEIICLAVMMYIRFPLSLRQVEDLLNERGIDICHETVRAWWNRFGPTFAAKIKRKRSTEMRISAQWRWHLDEVFVRINGEMHYLWRAVDHEGEVLEVFVAKKHDRAAALIFLRKAMKRYGNPEVIVTDRLRSYCAAMRGIGNTFARKPVVGSTTRPRTRISRSDDESKRWRDSEVQDRFRNSLRSTLQSITTSTRNAISTAAKFSSSTARPL
jgi:putative transposase